MHHIEFRGAIQDQDAGSGTLRSVGYKVVVKARPKNTLLAKQETGASMDIGMEFECTYIKVFYGEKEMIEVDKLNYIYKVEGIDFLENTRDTLGL